MRCSALSRACVRTMPKVVPMRLASSLSSPAVAAVAAARIRLHPIDTSRVEISMNSERRARPASSRSIPPGRNPAASSRSSERIDGEYAGCHSSGYFRPATSTLGAVSRAHASRRSICMSQMPRTAASRCRAYSSSAGMLSTVHK